MALIDTAFCQLASIICRRCLNVLLVVVAAKTLVKFVCGRLNILKMIASRCGAATRCGGRLLLLTAPNLRSP